MISFGRWGMYDGQIVFFTHRNPKNGEVWSDDIKHRVHTSRGSRIEHGMWVSSDKVTWLKAGKE